MVVIECIWNLVSDSKMANMDYGASILRIVVAQMCETVGWNSIQTTPLQLLTEVLQGYITEVAETAHRYAEQFGHTQPTLHDLGLAFQDMKINTGDLQEYIEYVAAIPIHREVPKYPISKESHLNLLKPGSREVVTRPVHIHEHLPAMHPEMENEDYGPKSSTLTVDTSSTEPGSPSNPFKRPGDPVSSSISPQSKQPRLAIEEEGRPLREISSVMMTTSGFLSPAREGKLPEATTPSLPSKLATHSVSSSSGSSSSYPTVPPEVKGEKKAKKKSTKIPKKTDTTTKSKEVIDLVDEDDSKVKKLVGMKELSKLKALKSFKPTNPNLSSALKKLPKIPKIKRKKVPGSKHSKIKLPAQSTDNTPLVKSDSLENEIDVCGNSDDTGLQDAEIKITSEPDKQKLNIFKKISKVKEDKLEHFDDTVMEVEPVSEAVPEKIPTKLEITKPAAESYKDQEPSPVESPPPSTPVSSNTVFNESAFDSPPGPPRTPEVIIPPTKKNKSKKHKKDKTKVKKVKPVKHQVPVSPEYESKPLEQEEIIEKPKTPEIEQMKDMKFIPTPSPVFSFFENFPSGPGLIPPQISSLFTPKPNIDKLNTLIPPPMVPIPKPTTPTLPHVDDEPSKPPIKSQLSPLLPTSPSPPSPKPTEVPPTPETPEPLLSSKPETITEKPPLFKVKLKEEKKSKKEHHKSDKKDKIKKKKHKKDKMKNKEEKDGVKKKEKSRDKKEKRKEEKKREKEKEKVEATSDEVKPSTSGNVPKITLKLAAEPPQVTEQSHRKIVIKPVKKPGEVSEDTTADADKPPKLKSSKKSSVMTSGVTEKPRKPPTNFPKEPKKSDQRSSDEPQPYYYDDKGNQVWICPGCRGPDDGSPMIGCDSCDAWYHWVCVGLQMPPESNDWFCKYCIARKDKNAGADKKKKNRKKLLAK